VGLLVAPVVAPEISRVHLTIDLTEPVYAEARAPRAEGQPANRPAELIVAYHPPIFGGLKRLRPDSPLTRTLLRAITDGVAIYSPHTALDAVPGGVNDWLLTRLGPCAEVRFIEASPSGEPGHGLGRVGRLLVPMGIDDAVTQLKRNLGLPAVRLAASERHRAGANIERVAVCPGAGGSLLMGVRDVDLIVTGEMRHHDVLACVSRGTSVVLTDHTHCERGFLPEYAQRLRNALPSLTVSVSVLDDDPLRVV
jgi:dinuclear metal center YbgI/SA1388 family protein